MWGLQVKKIKRAAERNYRARRRGWRPSASGGFTGICEEMSGGGVRDGERGKEMGVGQLLMGGKEESVQWDWDPGDGQWMVWEGDGVLEPQCLSDFDISEVEGAHLSLRQKEPGDGHETPGKMISWSRARIYKPCHAAGFESQASLSTDFGSQAPFPTFSASQALTSTRRSPSPQTPSSIWYQSNFGATYDVRNNTELDLLMHYLDNVFCLQFGFSCLKRSEPGSDRGRGWYLDTLLRCKPLYFATLSISAHHQHLVKGGNIPVSWAPSGTGNGSGNLSAEGAKVGLNWDAERNFVMTLKGLQGIIDELQGQGLKGVELLRERWQVLGTMCQLLSLEVC